MYLLSLFISLTHPFWIQLYIYKKEKKKNKDPKLLNGSV